MNEHQLQSNQNLITGVPTTEELAALARVAEVERSQLEDTFTREAIIAIGKGAVGTAAELNLAHPSTTQRSPINFPPLPEQLTHEPFVDDSMVSGEELKQLREQLRKEKHL